MSALKTGSRCATPHGEGVVIEREQFGNAADSFRYGVRHDKFPDALSKSLFSSGLVFYYPNEVNAAGDGT
jgi:hypothetical protein